LKLNLDLSASSGNSLQDGLEEVRSTGRPVMICILNQSFVREVLCSTMIIEVINHNFLGVIGLNEGL
jgi:hypothetical protein